MNEKKYYLKILNDLREGKSLNQITKEQNIDKKNLKKQLRKLFPQEYIYAVYGEPIQKINDNILRKIPKKQTSRTECDITIRAKEILKKKYDCIEEVGIWLDNYKKRIAIDLYSPKRKMGIELYWQSREPYSKLKKKLKRYKKYFGKIYCALLKDSSCKKGNRSYFYIKDKLRNDGFGVIILDISKTPHQ